MSKVKTIKTTVAEIGYEESGSESDLPVVLRMRRMYGHAERGDHFFRVGGTGDLRAFQTTVAACLILSGCAALTIFISPLVANYTFMNLVLFMTLFALGFLTVHIQGLNFWTEFTALTISAFVALNPQEAVPAQTTI